MQPLIREAKKPTKGDLDGNWQELWETTMTYLPDVDDRHRYGGLLSYLKDDRTASDGRLFLGMRRAPAAKGNHHAFEGGLVYHLLEMWTFWVKLREGFLNPPWITDAKIMRGIVNHDIHKAYMTYVLCNPQDPTAPWAVAYGKDDSDQLLGDTAKSFYLLGKAGIHLDPLELNALILSHGGWSELKPWSTSVLAKLLYLLDELSGNVMGRIDARTFVDRGRPEP